MTETLVSELQKIIDEMERLVQHPRIQQKTWVAKARGWLPVLRIANEQLSKMSDDPNISVDLTFTDDGQPAP